MKITPPIRVRHTYTQRLDGTPAEVFPLLCPVREVECVPGWLPGVVYSGSGVAERDCIFTTAEGEREAIWTIVEHDPASGVIEMLKVMPGYLVTRLRITLAPRTPGGAAAAVTYTYTALGPDGARHVAERTAAAYEEFMRTWEATLNRYLQSQRATRVADAAETYPT